MILIYCKHCGAFLRAGYPDEPDEHASAFECVEELRHLISEISVGLSDKPAE